MKVRVDVYTKDVDAALGAFKFAVESGATGVCLNAIEDYQTKKFQHLNLMFEDNHSSPAISLLDDGPFVRDNDEL